MAKQFTIGYKVKGEYYATVEAETLEEAVSLAEMQFGEADFNELCNSEGEAYVYDDADGNRNYIRR